MITVEKKNGAILLTPEGNRKFDIKLFNVDWLKAQGLLLAEKKAGRGSVFFFKSEGYDFVLRHYKRGGAVAKLTDTHYFWMGLEHSRPWREIALLSELDRQQLPAPKPAAAIVYRKGMFYQASLITYRLLETESMAEKLRKAPLPEKIWQAVGSTIRLFHDENIYHADLNADNILINSDHRVFVIDFDKGRQTSASNDGWKFDNLSRLQRSLKKQQQKFPEFHYSENQWAQLAQGYAIRYGTVKPDR